MKMELDSFNRTRVECKWGNWKRIAGKKYPFNRTRVECKYR